MTLLNDNDLYEIRRAFRAMPKDSPERAMGLRLMEDIRYLRNELGLKWAVATKMEIEDEVDAALSKIHGELNGGEQISMGWVLGRVMRDLKGRANPIMVKAMVEERAGEAARD